MDICKPAHAVDTHDLKNPSTQLNTDKSPAKTQTVPHEHLHHATACKCRHCQRSWLDQDQTHPARPTEPKVMTRSTEMLRSWFIADLTGTSGTTKTQVQAVRRGEGDWTGPEQMLHPHVALNHSGIGLIGWTSCLRSCYSGVLICMFTLM